MSTYMYTRYGDLPADMQQLIFDLMSGQGGAIERAVLKFEDATELVLRQIALECFPEWPVGADPQDARGQEHVEEMCRNIRRLPPVLTYGGLWLDGRHRVAAHRQRNYPTILAVDLRESIPGDSPCWQFAGDDWNYAKWLHVDIFD